MFTNQIQARYQPEAYFDNVRDQIRSSPLTAKATGKVGDEIVIFAIFKLSKASFFFVRYTARTRRSPRKSWKFAGYSIVDEGRDHTPRGNVKDVSFERYLSTRYKFTDYKIRWIAGKQNVKDQILQAANPFDYMIGPVVPQPGQTFEYANSITIGKPRKLAYRGAPNRA